MRRFGVRARRSMLWFIPLILLALGALLVSQYRFLRTVERTTVSAERDWLRNSLEDVTSDIEWRYRNASTRALSVRGGAPDVCSLGAHVRTRPIPGARSYFSIAFNGPTQEWAIVGPDGREKKPSPREGEAMKLATSGWAVAHKIGRIEPLPQIHVDERDLAHRVILRPIIDNETLHVVGVMGAVIDETLAQGAMLAIGKEALRKRERPDVSLRIAERIPVMPGGRDFITRPMGFIFTNWKAGVRDVCSSPEQIAASHFRINMLWTGSVTVVLFGAILLGVQAVARQMRLSQMKSDFVSNVSHELRTPLASIRVFGEYMRLGRVEKGEKIREYGEYIETESRRLTQLINNILDFSRIESAEKKYKFCQTDLASFVSQTVAAFAMPLRDHGYTVRFEEPATPVPAVSIDRDAFGQVLVNLLDNAVKYSGGREEIDVTVSHGAGDVRVSVRDYGIGIPAREQKRIFEKFYRVGSGLVHDVKGSGLGLAIVSHVVKAHGGRVEVSSTPGEGSTFTIVIPVGAAPVLETHPGSQEFA